MTDYAKEWRAPEQLSPAAADLLLELPPDLDADALARAYPQIMNAIVERWRTPRQLDAYFDSLLLDDRTDRKGFPFATVMAIVNLKEYYQSVVYPLRRDIWEKCQGSWGEPR